MHYCACPRPAIMHYGYSVYIVKDSPLCSSSPVHTMFSVLSDESSPEYFIKNVAFKTVPVEETTTAETPKKIVLENQNRLRNIKNQKIDKKNKLWGEFKKATRTQTGKNSGQ